ncbi:MAG: hypothetical protein ACK6AD_10085 [Cyanobacteriota bacterium]|jgi:hypothetical protein
MPVLPTLRPSGVVLVRHGETTWSPLADTPARQASPSPRRESNVPGSAHESTVAGLSTRGQAHGPGTGATHTKRRLAQAPMQS